MTDLIEDWIDQLPTTDIIKNDADILPVKPAV